MTKLGICTIKVLCEVKLLKFYVQTWFLIFIDQTALLTYAAIDKHEGILMRSQMR